MAEVKQGGIFILHVVVVGFHHKRGCQVDFSYPPLVEGEAENSSELPEEWKYLPFLALPDGAHNHTQDTIYFHLPAKDDKTSTVFGVSCYRQINTEDLICKTDDITRGTVQKSVCILSNLPVYGWIQAKLQLITHAYFEEKDFSQTEILKDLYTNLTLCISSHELISSSQMLIGLDARELVSTFKHKILVLFKLILLERRVLFYTSPVDKLCGSLLTLLSLFPGMIQHGLKESATFEQSDNTACDFELSDFGISTDDYLTLNESHIPNYFAKPKTDNLQTTSQNTDSQTKEEDPPQGSDDGLKNEGDPQQDSDEIKRVVDSVVQQGGELEIKNEGDPQQDSDEIKNVDDSIVQQGDELEIKNEGDPQQDDEIKNVDDSIVQQGDELEIKNEGDPQQDSDEIKNVDDSIVQQGDELEIKNEGDPQQDDEIKNVDDSIVQQGGELEENDEEIIKEDKFESDSGMFEKSTHSNISKQEATNTNEFGSKQVDVEGDKQVEGGKQAKVQSYEDELLEMIESELYGITLKQSSKENVENKDDEIIQTKSNGNELEIETGSSRFYAYNTLHYKNKHQSAEADDVETEKKKTITLEVGRPISSASDFIVVNREPPIATLNVDELGYPLSIFGKGSICQPYMALQQHDLLQDVNVRCFLIGATNILFKQKKHLLDIIVEPDEGKMIVLENDLKRELSLSTADFRFADVIVKSVMGDNDIMFDGTGWEGGNEWIRSQFRQYLTSLLASSLEPDSENHMHDYNEHFIEAWKKTHNYKIWRSKDHSGMNSELAGHPCKGQLGVADMKIRLQSAMQGSERGRKINNALSKTTVAIGNARSAVSSWFTSLAQEWKDEEDTGDETAGQADFSQTM